MMVMMSATPSMRLMTLMMMTCSIPTTSWMKNLKEIWTRSHVLLSIPITRSLTMGAVVRL